MQIIESQLLPTRTNIMDPSRKRYLSSLELLARGYLSLFAVCCNVSRNGDGHVELVWVGVGVLCLAQLLNGAGAHLEVLLEGWRVSQN